MSTSLSLNTSLLGQLYLPLEPEGGSNGGWNDDGSAYFISQGSEYALTQPTTTTSTENLSEAQLEGIQAAINTLIDILNENINSSNQQKISQLTGKLSTWLNGLSVGETVDLMTVTTLITHIRNNQGDDKATVTLTYAWVPALGVALPVTIGLDIDWAGSLQGLDTTIKTFASANIILQLFKDSIAELVLAVTGASIGAAFVFLAVAAVSLTVVAGVTKAMINFANDGGRVNFVAVIVHAINRITACVQPAPAAPANLQLPTVDVSSLDYTWIQTRKESSIVSGSYYYFQNTLFAGTYPTNGPSGNAGWLFSDGVVINNFNTTVLYPAGMPEISWSLNGAGMILSSKIEVDYAGENIFALALMIFNSAGQLVCVSTFMEDGASAGSISIPSPMAYPASYLVPQGTYGVYPLGSVIATEFPADNGEAFQISSAQLEWVIPELMVAFQNNIVMATPPSGNWAAMPQPAIAYAISWTYGASSYDSGQHPTICVDSSNQILEFHHNEGSNNFYWNMGKFTGSSISWTSLGNKRGGGDWPTSCVYSDSSFLEIHSGGTNNLYWETGYLTTDNGSPVMNWDESGGTKISDGNHPGMAINGSKLVVVMLTQGNNDLQYNVGQLTGSDSSNSMTWYKTVVDYASGDHASAVLAGNGCVLEVHSDGGDLYYNIGTASSSGISWQSSSPLPLHVKGDVTGMAMRSSDGLVCLVYSTNNDDNSYYGLGFLDADNRKIDWITLNNRYSTGAFPAIAFTPSGQLVESHQGSSNGNDLWWNVGTVTVPS